MDCTTNQYLTLEDFFIQLLEGEDFDCSMQNESLLDLLKKCIYMGVDGKPVLMVSGIECDLAFNAYKTYVLSQGGYIEDETTIKNYLCSIINE